MPLTNFQLSQIDSNTNGYMRNRIINGAMQIWQRGTTGTSGYTSVDRWQGGSTATFNQSSDVPSGFKYSLSFSIASAAYVTAIQNIESVNCYDLVGQSCTVSFWAKNSSGTSNLAVELLYATASDNFAGVTSIALNTVSASPSSSWTYYTSTFTSLPANTANGLQVRISRQNGASASTTLITGVQLEAGSVATPFEREIYSTTLAKCQRYYYLVATSGVNSPYINGHCWQPDAFYGVIQHPVLMRATPTFAATNTTNMVVYSGGGTYNSTAINAGQISNFCAEIIVLTSGMTTGRGAWLRAAASGSVPALSYSAEL
jgi:hypothetical protein